MFHDDYDFHFLKEKDETDAKAKEEDGPSTSKKLKLDDQEQDKIFDVYELQLSDVYEKLNDFLVTAHTNGQYENEHINYGLHLHPPKPKAGRESGDPSTFGKDPDWQWRIETDIPFLVTACIHYHLHTYFFYRQIVKLCFKKIRERRFYFIALNFFCETNFKIFVCKLIIYVSGT